MATNLEYVLKRLEAIEAELARIRRSLGANPVQEPPASMEGIWEGADITDEDIEEAKRSLFKSAHDDSI